eukprot:5203287-Pyramimonas_sp.AAC.1
MSWAGPCPKALGDGPYSRNSANIYARSEAGRHNCDAIGVTAWVSHIIEALEPVVITHLLPPSPPASSPLPAWSPGPQRKSSLQGLEAPLMPLAACKANDGHARPPP